MLTTTSCRLEQLSNELLLDILEYLDGYDLYQAFYGLNHRINTLLQSAQLYILDNSTKTDEKIWNTLKSFINRAQVRFISTNDDININKRFLSFYHDNVRSIRLTNISANGLDRICEQLSIDNNLKSLYIQQRYDHNLDRNTSIRQTILLKYAQQLRSLVNLSLCPCIYEYDFVLSSVIFSSLHHLSIQNHYSSPNLFQFLNENTPNLRSLKFIGQYQMMNPSITPIKHIEELHISANTNLITFQNMFSYFPGLRRLHIEWTCSRHSPFLNGSQWQQLFEHYIPHLKQWTIVFLGEISQDNLKTFYTGEFWSSKKVKVKMMVNKAQSRYPSVKSIYFGKEWHFGYINA